MRYEITGKIIDIPELQSGEGKNGTWRRQEFAIQIDDREYTKEVAFTIWGDKIDDFHIALDQQVAVVFDVSSRNYNGKWYTTLKPLRIDPASADGAQSADEGGGTRNSDQPNKADSPGEGDGKSQDSSDDDLPF